MKPLNILKE